MTAHLRLVEAGIREQSTYRLATLAGLVANVTFGLLKVAILFAAVRAAGGELHGYDQEAMSTYIWISQGLLGSVNLFGHTQMAERIKTGDVVVDFLRPLDVHTAAVATDLGRSLYALLPRGLPSILVGTLAVGIALPDEPAAYPLAALSVILGIVIAAQAVYLVAASGFWLVEVRGVQIFYMVISGFFAGLFVPIWFFPTWLSTLAQATPFPSMMMYPTDIVSGRTTGLDAVGLVALQALWFAVTFLAGHLMTVAGRRHLEVQGG